MDAGRKCEQCNARCVVVASICKCYQFWTGPTVFVMLIAGGEAVHEQEPENRSVGVGKATMDFRYAQEH